MLGWNLHAEWRRFRENCTPAELSGAFGDLGTLLPLLTGLAVQGQVSLPASLVLGGAFNIATGYLFRIPMCVQPMKAIAAAAIAGQIPGQWVQLAGFQMALALGVLAWTGGLDLLDNWVPPELIAGVQAGVGVLLASKGVQKMGAGLECGWGAACDAGLDCELCVATGAGGPVRWLLNNYYVSLGCLVLVVGLWARPKRPVGLLLFGAGLVSAAAITALSPTPLAGRSDLPPLATTGFIVSSWATWLQVFVQLTLAQLPLTLLNSVLSVSKSADDLFGAEFDGRAVAPPRRVALSVAAMNLIAPWFRAVPCCHGAGGLASQYRFGARTEVAVVFLGICKMAAGLLWYLVVYALPQHTGRAAGLLGNWPQPILGVMLAVSGLQLLLLGWRSVAPSAPAVDDAHLVLVVMLVAIVGLQSAGAGFMIGALVHGCTRRSALQVG